MFSAFSPINASMSGEISPHAEGPQIQRWFLGLEQSSERQLDPAESGSLRKRIRTLRIRPFLILGMVALLLSLIVLGLNSLKWESKAIDALISAFGISLILLGLPLWILVSRDALRDAKTLKNNIKIGRVFIFTGPVAKPLRHHRMMQGLIKERLLYDEINLEQRFDVLPNSGTVIKVNGKFPNRWWKEKVFEATAPPEKQYEALVKQCSPKGAAEDPVDLFQRHMSQEELEELTIHIAKLKRPPGALIVLAVWILILIIAIIMHASDGQLSQWADKYQMQAMLMCIFTAIGIFRYLRMLKTARLLSQDAGMKVLRLLRPRQEIENRTDENIPPVLEYLPVSQFGWSVYGKPYLWRLRKSRIPKN
jgi:hypothetical protein